MHAGIANPRWPGKRSRHSRRMRNPQFYVSGKRPMVALRHLLSWSWLNVSKTLGNNLQWILVIPLPTHPPKKQTKFQLKNVFHLKLSMRSLGTWKVKMNIITHNSTIQSWYGSFQLISHTYGRNKTTVSQFWNVIYKKEHVENHLIHTVTITISAACSWTTSGLGKWTTMGRYHLQ